MFPSSTIAKRPIYNTVSLMHMDGADGSTTFTDEKGLTWVKTPPNTGVFPDHTNQSEIQTAIKKYGTAGGLFGANSELVPNYPSNDSVQNFYGIQTDGAPFNVATGQSWCAECFVYKPTPPGDIRPAGVFGRRSGTDTGFCPFVLNTDVQQNLKILISSDNVSWDYVMLTDAMTVPYDTWTHVAVSVRGTTLKVYVNGTNVFLNKQSVGTSGFSLDVSAGFTASANLMYIGVDSNSRALQGDAFIYIDEFRFVLDSSVYNGDFTPPSKAFIL